MVIGPPFPLPYTLPRPSHALSQVFQWLMCVYLSVFAEIQEALREYIKEVQEVRKVDVSIK